MCELLIFDRDTEKWGDPLLEAQRFHAGDVVAVHENDHKWTDDELSIGIVMRLDTVEPKELGLLLGSDMTNAAEGQLLPHAPRIRILYVVGHRDLAKFPWPGNVIEFLNQHTRERPKTSNDY